MPWISERVLIRQLKELVADGVVARTDHGEMPPRVDYALTPYGDTLGPVLDAMGAWGQQHLRPNGRDVPGGVLMLIVPQGCALAERPQGTDCPFRLAR